MDGAGLASSSPRRLPRRQGKAVHHALIVGLLHGLPCRSKGCQLRASFPAPADTFVEAVEAPSFQGPTAALRFGLTSSSTYRAYPQVIFLSIPMGLGVSLRLAQAGRECAQLRGLSFGERLSIA
jgi:hypothetical protein